MADKSFGVKELNLLNASGTPTVTSPNNLNLNANTVAISTSCTIGSNLDVDGTTNLDNVDIVGITTIRNASGTKLYEGVANGSKLFHAGTERLSTELYGIDINGTLGADQINCSGVSTITVPANANPHSSWDVVNNSASAYRFTGPGQDGTEDNPDIYLVRGQRYVFKMNASGHPFQIRVSNGGSAYSDGVTNNGSQTGNVVFNVQHDAPAHLFYQCTSHGSMVGNIYIVGQHLANGADNRVLTATSAYGMNGEANLTYDGTDLTVTGSNTKIIVDSRGSNGDQAHLQLLAKDASGNNNFGELEYDGDGDFSIASRGSGSANNNIVFKTTSSNTERLRITSTGSVGIGTNNPDVGNTAYPVVQVHGTSTNAYFKLTNTTTGVGSGDGVELSLSGSDAYLTNRESANIIFRTGGSNERLRITSGGYVNIGGQSTQTTHLLHLQSTGDAGIHIRADSDNSGENDNPYLSMSQDGSTAQEFKIGQNGDAGQNFALSLTNSPFIHANHSAAYPLQLAHMDTMCVFISSRHNELGLNNYSGNTTAGMEIQNRGNDTATALKLTGHNNTGTPGVETFTQLTHLGSNLTFEIFHAGNRAFHIGSTRRIRVPGIVGVAGSGLVNVSVESDGNLCTTTSLREYKTNITSISDTSWLYNLNPVTFDWKKKTEVDGENVWEDTADGNGTQYGLIAEEVEAVKKEFCYYDNDNKLSGVHYERLIAPLIKALQEQKAEIDALKTRVATLEGS